MKKCVIALILVIALTLSVLPVASAAPSYDFIYVGGIKVNNGDRLKNDGSGGLVPVESDSDTVNLTYDAEKHLLTISDLQLTKSGEYASSDDASNPFSIGIYSPAPLTIECHGSSSVKVETDKNGNRTIGICTTGDLNIIGDGSASLSVENYNVSKDAYGLFVSPSDSNGGNLSIDNAAVTVVCKKNGTDLTAEMIGCNVSGNVSVSSSASLTCSAASSLTMNCALNTFGNISIDGTASFLSGNATNSYAISSSGQSVIINGNLTASAGSAVSGSFGLRADNAKLVVGASAQITALSDISGITSCAIRVKDAEISGKVNLTAGEAHSLDTNDCYSYGLYTMDACTVNEGAVIDAKSSPAQADFSNSYSAAIYVSSDLTISGKSSVKAVSGQAVSSSAEAISCGIYTVQAFQISGGAEIIASSGKAENKNTGIADSTAVKCTCYNEEANSWSGALNIKDSTITATASEAVSNAADATWSCAIEVAGPLEFNHAVANAASSGDYSLWGSISLANCYIMNGRPDENSVYIAPIDPKPDPTEPTSPTDPTEPTEPVNPPKPVENPFVDVKEKNWFYPSVMYCYENGIMNGMARNKFMPDAACSRAMIVTTLYRISKDTLPTVSSASNFSDVKRGAWYYDAVMWAESNGIVNGVSPTRFDPDANVTREQLVAILYRYADKIGLHPDGANNDAIKSIYSDYNKVSNYAKIPFGWAESSGIIKGSAVHNQIFLMPQANASRAEISAMLYRFCVNAHLIP